MQRCAGVQAAGEGDTDLLAGREAFENRAHRNYRGLKPVGSYFAEYASIGCPGGWGKG
ncbi:hypothetical protein C7S15_4182 [Burkholderia cepacia]|nr:hypothetical protein [Burkholderia cepacia]